MVKLLESEAVVFEAMSQEKGKTIAELITATGLTRGTISNHLRTMQKFEIIEKSEGIPPHKYKALPIKYKVVATRRWSHTNIDEVTDDHHVELSKKVELTDDQWVYLKRNRKKKRSELVKKLGISKLELYFALEKIGEVDVS